MRFILLHLQMGLWAGMGKFIIAMVIYTKDKFINIKNMESVN